MRNAAKVPAYVFVAGIIFFSIFFAYLTETLGSMDAAKEYIMGFVLPMTRVTAISVIPTIASYVAALAVSKFSKLFQEYRVFKNLYNELVSARLKFEMEESRNELRAVMGKDPLPVNESKSDEFFEEYATLGREIFNYIYSILKKNYYINEIERRKQAVGIHRMIMDVADNALRKSKVVNLSRGDRKKMAELFEKLGKI